MQSGSKTNYTARMLSLIESGDYEQVVNNFLENSDTNLDVQSTFLLAVAFHKTQKFSRAIQLYSDCINQNFNTAACFYNSAQCSLRLNDFINAEQFCFEASKHLYPNKEALLSLRVAIKLQQRDFETAVKIISDSQYKDLPSFFIKKQLASVYLRSGDVSNALFLYEEISKRSRLDIQCEMGRADCYRLQYQYTKAISIYKNVQKHLSSPSLSLLNNIGSCYMSIHDLEKAITYFKAAIKLDKSFALANNNLGMALHIKNQSNEARRFFHNAINSDPNNSTYYRNLSLTKKFTNSEDYDAKIILSPKVKFGNEDAEILFARGKVLDDLGKFEQAFKAFLEGNELRKKQLKYNLGNDINELTFIKSVSDRVDFQLDKERLRKRKPIFIVGLPRSGTSLLEQILSNHTEISALGELPYLNTYCKPIMKGTRVFDRKLATEIRSKYLGNCYTRTVNTAYFIDKMPSNFRWVGLIKSLLPEAKVIFMTKKREPLIWSNFTTYFAALGNGFAYSLTDLDAYLSTYHMLKRHWINEFPDIIELSYEDLISEPEIEVEKLCNKLHIEYAEGMLDIAKNPKHIFTASATQARTFIIRQPNNRWINYKEYLAEYL